ncbi:extended synaptotagmin-1 [Neolamprologus brichardi]|uniref:extended synaptotagmin-1 n=1 Tax=Neolamprologus brichardi TaxID=32507 RepID=UPI0016436B0D|nr:extended synaptotagmin-1 [Neolamprologus brichardi]
MPTADAEPGIGTEPLAPVSENQPQGERAVSVLWSFGKCLGALLPVYLAGYYGLSVSIVLFGLVIYMGWKHGRQEKVMRLKSAMYLLDNEREFTTQTVFRAKRDLPPWVSTDTPSVRVILCRILQQAWPFIGQYLEKLLVEIIAPAIRTSSIHLQTLSFTKVNIGDKALKVAGVKAHTENDKRQVMLDLYLSYAGDVEINVEIKKYFCKAGVKGVQLHGMLRVILEPLIGNIPLVGAVTMFFIRRPKLDINWTGLTNLLDIPGLNAMSDTMIMDAIASHLVLPNRLTIPLVADLHVAQLRSPLPRGVVRIHLLEAEDLTAKDTVIKGLIDGKSDPYAVLRVGTQIFTSHHVDSNLNPQWREMYEVIVHEVPGQELEVEVFDKDPDQDDFLGRVKIDLDIVKKARVVDDWFDLRDVASGSVHLRLEWLSLLSSADRLTEVIAKNQNLTSKVAEPPSAAILAVYLDQAYELPMRKGNKDPSPMVQISVQDKTKESKTCYGTTSPVWEDAFTFFIKDPHKQNIDIQVKDDDRALSLGSLKIPLARLVGVPELTMDQWFQLENSGSASRIFIKIVLRVGISHTQILKHLFCAQTLMAKDNFMGGMVKGKSDPYVKIRVGGITFRSHTIKENLNPVWNELYEVILTQLPGQEIQFELFDKDIDQDDFLGRFKLSLRDIISARYTDTWYTLNDVKSGRVHLMLEWLPRVSDLSRLEQILQYQSLQSFQNKVVPSAALVFVYVERAHGLPLKKNGKEPKVGAEIILKNVSYKTKVSERSTSPRWDEGFHFLISDPRSEILTVKLSHSWGQALGSLTLPLREVLAETDLVLDRWLNLDGALPESQILLMVILKILDTQLAVCRGAVGEGGVDYVIPKWDPSHLDLRHRPGFSIALVARSKDGADPYISFILLPDKKATTKRKTVTKKKDLSPEFNERFDFDLSVEESSQRRLDLSVKNSVSFISREKELIGKLQLDLDQIDLKTGVTQWYDLAAETN